MRRADVTADLWPCIEVDRTDFWQSLCTHTCALGVVIVRYFYIVCKDRMGGRGMRRAQTNGQSGKREETLPMGQPQREDILPMGQWRERTGKIHIGPSALPPLYSDKIFKSSHYFTLGYSVEMPGRKPQNVYMLVHTHSFGALIVTLKSLPPIRDIALIRRSHVWHLRCVHMYSMCTYVCAHVCVYIKRHDQTFFFLSSSPWRRVIRALSVLVPFHGPDKRDAADTLHLQLILTSCPHSELQQHSFCLSLSLFFCYPLCLKLMTIWSGSFVWVFPSD